MYNPRLSTRHLAIRAKSVSVRVCPCSSVCSRHAPAAPPRHFAIRVILVFLALLVFLVSSRPRQSAIPCSARPSVTVRVCPCLSVCSRGPNAL